MSEKVRVGTAGWALPAPVRDAFPAAASNLARYAGRLDAVEINSCFHRPHRRATYERWAASVPEDFRFAVKLPKAITHGLKLRDCEAEIARFAEETGGLGIKRGPVLVQLPPSLAFDPALAIAFFTGLDATLGGPIVCEPRHPSWFEAQADALLAARRIARVAADPAPVLAADAPGGWRGLAYFRLHGSPSIYRSGYEPAARAEWARRIRPLAEAGTLVWAIFDNTAGGRATPDALAFAEEGGG
ncbi:MAG TPA: DUF72 domain-containing protein [Allosphingosinicella sp.]|jgi:uncharacterized protein YecE (DUF72 family)|nr:DUF72 domain-containing protein [Allosphingosinicella sp.]